MKSHDTIRHDLQASEETSQILVLLLVFMTGNNALRAEAEAKRVRRSSGCQKRERPEDGICGLPKHVSGLLKSDNHI